MPIINQEGNLEHKNLLLGCCIGLFVAALVAIFADSAIYLSYWVGESLGMLTPAASFLTFSAGVFTTATLVISGIVFGLYEAETESN